MTDSGPHELRVDAHVAAEWLDEHGDALFAYARARVESAEVAEDLVQETLIAAIRGYANFEGRSTVRTWLTGILRRKIVDQLRRTFREREFARQRDEPSNPFFASNGHWHGPVNPWPDDPQKALENKEFWRTLDQCCRQLTGPIAAVFRMRELEQMSTDEICKALEITPTNLSVRLHRARLSLRMCLEQHWFLAKSEDSDLSGSAADRS